MGFEEGATHVVPVSVVQNHGDDRRHSKHEGPDDGDRAGHADKDAQRMQSVNDLRDRNRGIGNRISGNFDVRHALLRVSTKLTLRPAGVTKIPALYVFTKPSPASSPRPTPLPPWPASPGISACA